MTEKKFTIMSQRRVLKLSATFFISLLLLGSCKKEPSAIGDSLQGASLNVITSDTFSLVTYTDELDEMESDETAVNLLGHYKDPVFGSVDCGIVTQLRLSSSNPSFAADPADVIVDSVVLQLAYTGIKWYGNLDPITVEVYEMNEDLTRDDQDYYTHTVPVTFGTDLVAAGSAVIKPDVISEVFLGTDTVGLSAHLRIRLDNALVGDNLVNLNGSGSMATDETFVSAFKGLYIKADGSSLVNQQGSILYFGLESSLSKMVLYFHEIADVTPKTYDFNINSSAARYNTITHDRTGTDVEALLMDPSLGQTEFYTQAGASWAVVEFPHIMSLNVDSLGNEAPKIINKAELVLPVQDFTQDSFDPSVNLFIARIVSDTTSDFTLDYSLSSTIAGNTVTYDQTNKEYRFNMTLELQAILNGERENTGFRIYAPSFFASSVERVIFNGPNSPLKDKARLEITYTDY